MDEFIHPEHFLFFSPPVPLCAHAGNSVSRLLFFVGRRVRAWRELISTSLALELTTGDGFFFSLRVVVLLSRVFFSMV
jgi:hypothetical protein